MRYSNATLSKAGSVLLRISGDHNLAIDESGDIATAVDAMQHALDLRASVYKNDLRELRRISQELADANNTDALDHSLSNGHSPAASLEP